MTRKPVVIETVRNPCWYSARQLGTFRLLAAAVLESGRFLVFVEPENAPAPRED